MIQKIKKAGENKNTIHLTYKDSKGNISTRDIEPYELTDDSLFGYDIEKQSIKRFKILGIINIEINRLSTFIPKFPIKL